MIHKHFEELSAQLDELMDKVVAGTTVRIYRGGRPVADVIPYQGSIRSSEGLQPDRFYDPTEPESPE